MPGRNGLARPSQEVYRSLMKLPSTLVRVSTGERFPVSEVSDGLRIVGEGTIDCEGVETFFLEYAGARIEFKSDLRGTDEWTGSHDDAARLYV